MNIPTSTSRSSSFIIRADASPQMGTGHVMRCFALAQAAQDMGLTVHLMGRVNVPWVLEKLRSENIPFTRLEGEVPKEESPEAFLALIRESGLHPDWIVTDGYHFTLPCQKAVREAGYKLLVIDDYNHLPEYSCDILLNQNLGAEDFAYSGDIGTKLLGPKYALLRREFVQARQRAEQRQFPAKPEKLLLTLGGGDFSSFLPSIADALTLPELTGCTLRVIQGGMREEDIRRSLAKCPATLEILGRVDDMPALLLDTDLCITAGGSTCWELCAMGVPFLVLAIAENQKNVCGSLCKAGWTSIFSIVTVKALLHPLGKFFPVNGVDAEGGTRVLRVCEPLHELCVRKITLADSDSILHLANDVDVRKNALTSSKIEASEHSQWFKCKLEQIEDVPFFIVHYHQQLVGYVRFDKGNDKGTAIVTIAVSPQWRDKKIGTAVLQKCCQMLPKHWATVIAYVKPENFASQKMFVNAGFIFDGEKIIKHVMVLCYYMNL